MDRDNRDPEPGVILAQLDRIVTTGPFDASERNRRFLRYIVEEALAGRADRIKAYNIATAVFGRDEEFDPQSDPIVRVEAGRLRRALERYYLTAGQEDPVRISIPKGSYIPEFAATAADAPATETTEHQVPPPPRLAGARPPHALRAGRPALAAAGLAALVVAGIAYWVFAAAAFAPKADAVARSGPAILVLPFERLAGSPATQPDLARGMTREITAGLARFTELNVFGPEADLQEGAPGDAQKTIDRPDVDYVLSGAADTSAGRFRVVTSLIDARSNKYLWSGSFEGDLAPAELLKVQENVSAQIVEALAQPYGVIFADKVRAMAGKPAPDLGSYECVLQFQVYWRKPAKALYPAARACLERAIAADPHYPETFASLALLYIDAHRFPLGMPASPGEPIGRALQLAQKAVELAPQSARAYRALQLAYWFSHDLTRSFEAGERGLALNPNDSEMMAELGFRLCLTGRWQRGLPMVEQAFARDPDLPDEYRVAIFLDRYINGRYEEALGEAKRIELPSVVLVPVMEAMALARLGRTAEARVAVAAIVQMHPAYGEHVIEDLASRNLNPALIELIVDGLRGAGLAVKRESALPGGPRQSQS